MFFVLIKYHQVAYHIEFCINIKTGLPMIMYCMSLVNITYMNFTVCCLVVLFEKQINNNNNNNNNGYF